MNLIAIIIICVVLFLDVDSVENLHLLKQLKIAHANRLKEYDIDPALLQKSAMIVGSMSKLFKVNFEDRT